VVDAVRGVHDVDVESEARMIMTGV
jgi:hypothetical protein